MMKKFLFILLIGLQTSAFAQVTATGDSAKVEPKWTTAGKFSLGITQTASQNWTAGAVNSYSGNGLVHLELNYKHKSTSWKNQLDLGYGALRNQAKDSTNKSYWKNPQKTDDKIDFNSALSWDLDTSQKWLLTSNYNFKSQFANAYNDPETQDVIISKFMAPAYSNLSLGLTHTPNKVMTTYLSPIAWRAVYVTDPALSAIGAFGVDSGKTSVNQFGAYLKNVIEKEIMKNVVFKSKLELYSNYIKNPENLKVWWDLMLDMKINNYLSTALTLNLIYDDEILIADERDPSQVGPRLQMKQTLALNVNLSF